MEVEPLRESTSREVIMKITTYELTQGEEHEDQLVCNRASHGGFSFKSAISIVRKDLQGETDVLWTLIWQAPTPQSMCFFSPGS